LRRRRRAEAGVEGTSRKLARPKEPPEWLTRAALTLMTVEITCTVRGPLPRRSGLRRGGGSAINIPFEKIAREILGRQYVLSLVLSGDTLARRINRAYRKKDYAPNVLSFPLLKNEGEIFLNVRKAEREARSLGIPERSRIAHLFAHGCLHLAGLPHGKKMDESEKKILAKFGF